MNRHQRRAAAKSTVAGGTGAAVSLQLGIANFRAGLYAEAERQVRQVLAREPKHAEALHLLGCVYIQTNRSKQGVDSIQRAIAIHPSNAEFHSNLATGFDRLNRLEEAVEAYGRSVDLDETKANVFIDFGMSLEKLERWAPALASYAKAVLIDPMNASAHANIGRMLHKFERFDDALTSFDAAVALAPDDAPAYCWRSSVLFAMKRFDEALATADQAVTIAPETSEPHNMRGVALYRFGRHEEAERSFTKALCFNPDSAEVLLNRASVYVDLHLFKQSDADIGSAIRLKPDYAEAHNNMGLHALLLGDFERGWIETEWRWKCAGLKLKAPEFAQPQWLGENIAGKTILLHSDQGLGDAINFVRYVPLVAAQGARVILVADPPLMSLLKTVDGVDVCINKEGQGPLPDFDLHCPLSSLPLAFNTVLDTIPADVPYIRTPDSGKWAARLGTRRTPRVGFVWSGNPNHGNDHNRSLAFAQIAPLLDLPLEFYSLQKDVRASDRDALGECRSIVKLGGEITDFTDTAELLSHLDLLITADTSIAHLAGAIALPTWIMLPYTPDWRWLLDRNDSPWYPSVRLFRQDDSRRWDSVVSDLRSALQTRFAPDPHDQASAALTARRCNYSLSSLV